MYRWPSRSAQSLKRRDHVAFARNRRRRLAPSELSSIIAADSRMDCSSLPLLSRLSQRAAAEKLMDEVASRCSADKTSACRQARGALLSSVLFACTPRFAQKLACLLVHAFDGVQRKLWAALLVTVRSMLGLGLVSVATLTKPSLRTAP